MSTEFPHILCSYPHIPANTIGWEAVKHQPLNPDEEKYQGEENSALGSNLLFSNPINPHLEIIQKEKQ